MHPGGLVPGLSLGHVEERYSSIVDASVVIGTPAKCASSAEVV